MKSLFFIEVIIERAYSVIVVQFEFHTGVPISRIAYAYHVRTYSILHVTAQKQKGYLQRFVASAQYKFYFKKFMRRIFFIENLIPNNFFRNYFFEKQQNLRI